jgi:pimeloyl-ACP methyl ester carboxylesterase
MLGNTDNASNIPLVVSRAAAGDYGPLNKWITLEGPPSPQWPMYWSIWCNEPFVGLDAHGPWHTDFDSDVSTRLISFFRSVCAGVPKQVEPASEWTLLRSRVPVLVLAGGADPQDPITSFPQLKEMFPNSRTIVAPHQGHWVAPYGCLPDLIGSFVARGSATGLDAHCVGEIHPPAFALR